MIDNKYGLINNSGDFIIEPIYDSLGQICGCSNICKDLVFKNRTTIFEKDDMHGLIDIDGNVIVDLQEDRYIKNDINYWCVYDSILETCEYIDLSGKSISENELKSITTKNENNDRGDLVVSRKTKPFVGIGWKYGLIDDISGEVVVDDVYDWINGFSDGLAYYINNGKSGYMNELGESVITLNSNGVYSDFHEGLAAFELSELSNTGSGYMNKEGKVVIELPLDMLNKEPASPISDNANLLSKIVIISVFYILFLFLVFIIVKIKTKNIKK